MQLVILFILLIYTLALMVSLLSQLRAHYITRVPFVPTHRSDVVDLVKRLPVTAKDIVIDLGCGNGRVLFVIERLTGATVRGYEMEGWPFWYAKIKRMVLGSKVKFVSGSFFNHNWSDSTIIYAYLLPFLLPKVWEKFKSECAPGTRLVSRDFLVPGVAPTQEWKTPSNHTMRVYTL